MEKGGKGDLRCEACSLKLAALATKLCQTRGSLAQGCQAALIFSSLQHSLRSPVWQTQSWALGKQMNLVLSAL